MNTKQLTTKTVNAAARTFRDSKTWQGAYDLTVAIYRQCERFPEYELNALANQMTGAAVAVCSQIAVAVDMRVVAERDRFYALANGSVTELENQLLICRGVGYINSAQFLDLQRRCFATHKLLAALQDTSQRRSKR